MALTDSEIPQCFVGEVGIEHRTREHRSPALYQLSYFLECQSFTLDMKLSEHKNSKKQGDAGMGAAIGWFTENGYTVCVPLTDSQQYDLVVDIDGKLSRVQVKTTNRLSKYGVYDAPLAVCGGNRSNTGKTTYFDPAVVEYLFVLTGDKSRYFIPSFAVRGRTAICLGKSYQQYRIVS